MKSRRNGRGGCRRGSPLADDDCARRGRRVFRDRRFSPFRRCARLVLDALQRLLSDGWYGLGPGPGGRRHHAADSDRVLLSQTHLWLRTIPSSVQPKQLCRQFPRVANLIAANWDDTVLTDRVLIDLMTDNRGDRAGFPARVRAELHELSRLNLNRPGDTAGSAARRWQERRMPKVPGRQTTNR